MTRTRSPWLRPGVLSAALAVAAPCRSQEILWQTIGEAVVNEIGGLTVYIGDADGDGYDDLAHGARIGLGLSRTDAVHIISGRDGSTLRTFALSQPHMFLGNLLRAGDWDGDGIVDYAIRRYGRRPTSSTSRSAVAGTTAC